MTEDQRAARPIVMHRLGEVRTRNYRRRAQSLSMAERALKRAVVSLLNQTAFPIYAQQDGLLMPSCARLLANTAERAWAAV